MTIQQRAMTIQQRIVLREQAVAVLQEEMGIIQGCVERMRKATHNPDLLEDSIGAKWVRLDNAARLMLSIVNKIALAKYSLR